MPLRLQTLVPLAVFALGLQGCDGGYEPGPTVSAASMRALSVAESAGVLTAFSRREFDSAERMRSQTHDAAIREYAQALIDGSRRWEAETARFLDAQRLTPAVGAVSRAVDAEQDEITKVLCAAKEDSLDVSYIDTQLASQRHALALLDCAMVPGMQDAAFRGYLEGTVRPEIERRLDRARELILTLRRPVDRVTEPLLGEGSRPSGESSCSEACDARSAAALPHQLLEAACANGAPR